MPKTIAELKASSPAYANMSDAEFSTRVYNKHYAGQMSFEEFAARASGSRAQQGTGALLERPKPQPTQAQQVRGQLQRLPRDATARLRGEQPKTDINAQLAGVPRASRRINELEAERARLEAESLAQSGDSLTTVRGAVGSTLGGLGLGVQQLYTDTILVPGSNLVASGLDAIGLDGAADYYRGAVVNPAEQRSRDLRSDVRFHREATAGLRNSGPVSATAGVLTDATTALGPGLVARGTKAGTALLPTTFRGNVAAGAALGAVQPYEDGSERALNVAGGAGGGGLGYGLGQVFSRAPGWFARDGLNRLDRRAGQVLKDTATDATSIERAQPSMVPGVQRTLGEATLDPGIMALERQARTGHVGQGIFTPIDDANNAARVAALRGIAGDDADMAAAEAAREAASRQARETAFGEARQFDEAATAQQQAARQASEAAEAEAARYRMFGMEPPTGAPVPQVPQAPKAELTGAIGQLVEGSAGRPSVQNTLRSVLGAVGDAPDNVTGLYNARKYVTDLLEGKAGSDMQAARAATRELMQVRDLIDAEITQRAPSWGNYLTSFQQGSKPINRMQVGRELLDRGSLAGRVDNNGENVLAPAAFTRNTRDAGRLDALAARATGFKKAKAADILSSDDLALVRNIADDLQRVQRRQSNPALPGQSRTNEAGIMQRTVERAFGMTPMPAGLARFVDDALRGVKAADAERLNQRLAQLIANPQEAQAVMAKLSARDRRALQAVLASQQAALAGAAVSSGD